MLCFPYGCGRHPVRPSWANKGSVATCACACECECDSQFVAHRKVAVGSTGACSRHNKTVEWSSSPSPLVVLGRGRAVDVDTASTNTSTTTTKHYNFYISSSVSSATSTNGPALGLIESGPGSTSGQWVWVPVHPLWTPLWTPLWNCAVRVLCPPYFSF